jgi:hypothetical protein
MPQSSAPRNGANCCCTALRTSDSLASRVEEQVVVRRHDQVGDLVNLAQRGLRFGYIVRIVRDLTGNLLFLRKYLLECQEFIYFGV